MGGAFGDLDNAFDELDDPFGRLDGSFGDLNRSFGESDEACDGLGGAFGALVEACRGADDVFRGPELAFVVRNRGEKGAPAGKSAGNYVGEMIAALAIAKLERGPREIVSVSP